MFNIGFEDLATLCVVVVPVFQHSFQRPWVRGRMWVSQCQSEGMGSMVLSSGSLPTASSLKMVAGTCATTLEQLEHTIQLNLKSQSYAFFVYSFTFLFSAFYALYDYVFYLCYFCILNILLRTVERIVNVKLYILHVSCLNWIHCFKHIRCHMCGPQLDLCWVTPVECISKRRPRDVSFFTPTSTPILEPNLPHMEQIKQPEHKAHLSPATASEVMYWVVLSLSHTPWQCGS